MNYRIFKDKKISLLGFGGMRLPTRKNGKIDYEQGEKMVEYAYNNGVNYFDTAYMYHNGESEVFFGKVMQKYPRDTFYLTSKMPSWLCKKEDDVEKIFNEQLSRCQVDYFDFYLLHSVTWDNYPISEKFNVVEKLFKFKDQGKIKHLGFSFHGDKKLLIEVLEKYGHIFEFVQLQINYYDYIDNGAKEFYDLAVKFNLPVIIMEPVRGGLLAKLSKKSRDILIKSNSEMSVASWAIRFCGDLENVITVLSGMSNMEQTVDNIKNLSMPKLTSNEYGVIDTALSVFKKNRTIPCTGCRYCMDCVKGIDIPLVFSIYNEYKVSKNKNDFYASYNTLEHKNDKCINCRKCVKECPQGIDIPKMLSKVAKQVKEGN